MLIFLPADGNRTRIFCPITDPDTTPKSPETIVTIPKTNDMLKT